MSPKRVAIIGGGNMGSAIARGIWENEDLLGISSDRVVIAEPDQAKHGGIAEGNQSLVVMTAGEAVKALDKDGFLVIAVKPQLFAGVASEVAQVGARLVITVMAGRTAASVHRELGGTCRVVRAMPNLPLIYGQGMTAICPGPGATEGDLTLARSLFGRLGRCIDLDESLMDAMTAVASSGVAYLFYLAEAMARGAVSVGFEAGVAQELVRQTIWGAAWMLIEETAGPAELRARVTSLKGTTAAAVSVLDAANVQQAFERAIVAARDRGRELAAQ